jgi:hypothetical protein
MNSETQNKQIYNCIKNPELHYLILQSNLYSEIQQSPLGPRKNDHIRQLTAYGTIFYMMFTHPFWMNCKMIISDVTVSVLSCKRGRSWVPVPIRSNQKL